MERILRWGLLQLCQSLVNGLHTYFQWTEDGKGFQIQYLPLNT